MTRCPSPLRALSLLAALALGTACGEASPAAPATADLRATGLAPAMAQATVGPQACRPDAKLIGRIELATRDEPGTWWHLTRSGLDATGTTDYRSAIGAEFGIDFPDLDAAVHHLVEAVRALDANGNGYVCAYSGRGTLGWSGDPDFWAVHFGVRDDKHVAP
jgi:hypothetical protein